MSRHRNVRSLNYEEDFYDEDDAYGHSIEDNYCISPATAAQFTFNRERNVDLSNFMGEEGGIPEEDEEGEDVESTPDTTPREGHRSSLDYTRPKLSDIDEAKLNSCLEEIHNVLGESIPEHILVDTIVRNNFSIETSLNELLSQQADAPKPQRVQRPKRRNQSQELDDDIDYMSDSPSQGNVFSYIPTYIAGNMKFGASCSPQSPLLSKNMIMQSNIAHVTDLKHEDLIIQPQFALSSVSGRKHKQAELDETTCRLGSVLKAKESNVATVKKIDSFGKQLNSVCDARFIEHELDVNRVTLQDLTNTHQANSKDIAGLSLSEMAKQQDLKAESKLDVSLTKQLTPANEKLAKMKVINTQNPDQKLKSGQSVSLADLAKSNEKISEMGLSSETKSDIGKSLSELAMSLGKSKSPINFSKQVDIINVPSEVKPQSVSMSLSNMSHAHLAQKQLTESKSFPLLNMSLSEMAKTHGNNDKSVKSKPHLGVGMSLAELSQAHSVNKQPIGLKPQMDISLSELARAQNVDKQSLQLKSQSNEGISLSKLATAPVVHKPMEIKPTSNTGLSLTNIASAHGVDKPTESKVLSSSGTFLSELAKAQVDKPSEFKTQSGVVSLSEMAKTQPLESKLHTRDGKLAKIQNVGKQTFTSGWALSAQNNMDKTHNDKSQTMLSLTSLVEKHAVSKKDDSSAGKLIIVQHCAFESPNSGNKKSAGLGLQAKVSDTNKGKKVPPISLADLARCKPPLKSGKITASIETSRSTDVNVAELGIKDKSGTDKNSNVICLVDDDADNIANEPVDIVEVHVEDIHGRSIRTLTRASNLGKTLCLKVSVKKKNCSSGVSYIKKRFNYNCQMKGVKNKSPVHLKKVIPFDFSTPSPDDIVKSRQKCAFTRSGDRKISL